MTSYILNDNNSTGNAYGISADGDAYGIGNGNAYGGSFSATGGSTSGDAMAIQSVAAAYGTSVAYGVYSDASQGTTTGREWAFYGLGDNYFSGNVGIGTDAPARKLHISDAMRLEPITSPPASPSNGDLYFDSSDALCVRVNAGWEKIAGSGSCS